ncbi:MAG: nuoN [Gammaproteobacteria bacterium]|jgi:NADH-quinone oxidoreductase subunit N|nr:nuoN [Gammaproteobacteria bacterium]
MNFEIPNFALALPEIFVLTMACAILLIDLFIPKHAKTLTYLLAQITLLGAAILTFQQYGHPGSVTTFNGMFVLNNLAIVLKLFIYLSAFASFLYARSYLPKTKIPYGEYFVLGLFSVLGMMVIVSAHNFIVLFLGLELFSLPIYAMVALRRDEGICVEAAIKYFVTGAIATGTLLYGLSMLYGATGSMDITRVSEVIMQSSLSDELILVFGLVFAVVGMVFKLGAVPFHMWVPDVYEGAPTPVVLFLGTTAKIAALGLLFRLLVDGLQPLSVQWQDLLIIVAVLSMALGNLAAIVQSNIKRMLAYSSIAHMGYMALGLVTATPQGYGAALFYMITYAIMTLGAFGVVAIMNNAGCEASKVSDLRGLNSRNPWLALMMLLVMFSMAGIPPIVGFMAKLSILEALIGVHLVWLAAIALFFAVIGAYYYIRVVKVMYFEEPEDATPIKYPVDMQIAISLSGVGLLVLGIVPGALFTLCQAVFGATPY